MALRIITPKNRISALIRFCYQNQNKFGGTLNRGIHLSTSHLKRVAFNLSDIGEGIREVVVKVCIILVFISCLFRSLSTESIFSLNLGMVR